MKRRNFTQKLRIKEHRRGKFQNPYFKHRRLKKKKQQRFTLFLIAAAILALPIAFVFGPWQHIRGIEVSGVTTLSPSDIETIANDQLIEKRFLLMPQKNKLFFSQSDLIDSLQASFQLTSIDVELKARTIHIHVEEAISEIVWVSDDTHWFLDLNGHVLRPLEESERAVVEARLRNEPQPEEAVVLQPTMPLLFDESNGEVQIGEHVLRVASVQNIIDFDKAVRRLLVTPKTYGMESREVSWLRMDTETHYDLLFDASEDIEDQISVLQSILQDYDDLQVEEYIDLRFGNRVYTK